MKHTPRTDAATYDGWSGDAFATDPDLSRQLEVELNEALAKLKSLEPAIQAAREALEFSITEDIGTPNHKARLRVITEKARAALQLLTPKP